MHGTQSQKYSQPLVVSLISPPTLIQMDSRIQRVIALIDGDADQWLTLDDMAKTVRLSPSRLRHKFKAEVGVTPAQYLRNVRMTKAAKLLKDGNLSIKEVRVAIGLESDSYFTHLCERFYGQPPSRIRNS